jgi:hypothetical protein
MPEAALYYGLLMAKVAPDTALIPFAIAMLWSLVRLNESGDGAGGCGRAVRRLALLSKFTALMLLPAVLAFMLVPDWRGAGCAARIRGWRALIASRVLAGADLELSARLGLVPLPVRARGRTNPLSFRTVGEFFGLQFGLVGFVLLPVVISGVALTAWRGYRSREPVAILLSTGRDRAVRLFLLEVADAARW